MSTGPEVFRPREQWAKGFQAVSSGPRGFKPSMYKQLVSRAMQMEVHTVMVAHKLGGQLSGWAILFPSFR